MRLLKTGVLKGFMIFLIATDEPVSWSLAELEGRSVRPESAAIRIEDREEVEIYQTSPKAPAISRPYEQEQEKGKGGRTHSDWLQVDIAGRNLIIDGREQRCAQRRRRR